MKLSEIIREYRESHNMSGRQFAIKCDLSNGYISMLEREKNPTTGEPIEPSLQALSKIALGMGISLDDLLLKMDKDSIISLRDVPQSASFEDGQLLEYFHAMSERDKGLLLSIAKGMAPK